MQIFATNKRSVTKMILALMIGVMLLGCTLTGCQQTSSTSATAQQPATSQINVRVSVDTTQVPDAQFNREAPGVDEITVEEGATAYDTLAALGLDTEGTSSFVTSIGGLSSGDWGPMSGWMYTVNRETPMTGPDAYILSEGDTVAWVYVTEFPDM